MKKSQIDHKKAIWKLVKKFEKLICCTIIAIAIIISGALIADTIKVGFDNLRGAIVYLAELQPR